MRISTPLLLLLPLLALSAVASDDFAEFDDGAAAVGGTGAEMGSQEEFAEFEEEEEESVESLTVENDDSFDFDDDEDDGEVESEEVGNEKVASDLDEFDFGDDQVIITEPGDQGADPVRKPAKDNKKGNKLKMNEVPEHLRPSWKAFWIEGCLVAFIVYYIFNYFMGLKQNENIAKALMGEYKEYLQQQFSQVGSDNDGSITAQSHNNYTVWCTGRKGIEGMMVEINLVPRQDLITLWRNKFNRKRPQTLDTVTFSCYMDENEPMEPVVLCLGKNRAVNDLWAQYSELRTFCPKGPKDKSGVLKGNIGCAESQEMLTYLFDERNRSAMQDREGAGLHYIHITDNCQPRDGEDTAQDEATEGEKTGKATKLMVVSLQIDDSEEKFAENSAQFLKGTVTMLDKLKRMKLSREVKSGCEKRRAKAIEEIEKRKHNERHQMAAQRKEDARRRLNRKIEEEEDPDKQRRLHEQMMKKDAKDRAKRMKSKQVKVH